MQRKTGKEGTKVVKKGKSYRGILGKNHRPTDHFFVNGLQLREIERTNGKGPRRGRNALNSSSLPSLTTSTGHYLNGEKRLPQKKQKEENHKRSGAHEIGKDTYQSEAF